MVVNGQSHEIIFPFFWSVLFVTGVTCHSARQAAIECELVAVAIEIVKGSCTMLSPFLAVSHPPYSIDHL
jgi:hypothetical protein